MAGGNSQAYDQMDVTVKLRDNTTQGMKGVFMDAKSILRWILVAPAAVLAAIIVWQVCNFFMYDNPLLMPLASFAQGYAFILAGCMVAPRAKKKTAIALGLVGVIIAVLSGFAALQQQNWLPVAYALLMGAGIIVAAYTAHRSSDGVPMP